MRVLGCRYEGTSAAATGTRSKRAQLGPGSAIHTNIGLFADECNEVLKVIRVLSVALEASDGLLLAIKLD